MALTLLSNTHIIQDNRIRLNDEGTACMSRYTWLFDLPDIIRFWGLPRGCWHCELLGLCRRPKNRGWECIKGCLVLEWEKEKKFEGLPRGCWNCKYLLECRGTKEEGWKCYNGCRIINEKRVTQIANERRK